MTKYQKLIIDYARLLGEFKGTLQGVTYWDIPKELKKKLSSKIIELEKIDIEIEDS